MTDSEIVEAARRYPSVEEIAALLRAHRLLHTRDHKGWLWTCRDCGASLRCAHNGYPSLNFDRQIESKHAAEVIVAMWEELAREAAK